MPVNQLNKKIHISQLNSLSTIKYNNVNIKSKTKMRKVQENIGKLLEERKLITEINRVYSWKMPIEMDNKTKNNQNMANKEKELKDKARYNIFGLGFLKQKFPEYGIGSQKDNKLLKLTMNKTAEHFLSVLKSENESKNIESSNKTLEWAKLKSGEITQIISNSDSKYDSTSVQSVILTETHTSKDLISNLPSQIQRTLNVSQKQIWFLSDEGSDRNNCQTESTPCKSLQTVLDKASDGAEIYVTSKTLSLDLVNDTVWYKMSYWRWPVTGSCCLVNSSLTYTLRSISVTKTSIICSGEHCCIHL